MINIDFGASNIILKYDKLKLDDKLLSFNTELKCPYCKFNFNDEKSNKFSCRNCKQSIFIRKINDRKYYLTNTQNEEIGIIKYSYSLINKYYSTLINYGYEKVKLDNHLDKIDWQDTQALKEFILSVLDNLALINTEDDFDKSNIFFTMARFSANEMNGKNVYEFQKKGFNLRLKDYEKKSSSLVNEYVRIIVNQKNPICSIDNNIELPLQEMMKNPLLPHKNTGDIFGCQCMYGITVERDAKGSIIFNDEEEIQRAINNMKNKKND